MFTSLSPKKMDKATFKDLVPNLRQQLLSVQRDLASHNKPVIIVFAGVDGAGKSEIVNLLNEWMDPRWLITCAYDAPSEEERQRPEFWRYWRDLPPAGQIGLFQSAWYSRPLVQHVQGNLSKAELNAQLERINLFEETQIRDGAVVLKFWLHLDKEAQEKRFKKLEKKPATAWKVTEQDWQNLAMYDEFINTAEHMIRRSNGLSQWHIVPGNNFRQCAVDVATTILEEITGAINQPKLFTPPPRKAWSGPNYLDNLASDLELSKTDYKEQLADWQAKLNQLQRTAKQRRVSTIMALEGWDAAGKGGAIRRVIHPMQARDYSVIPIAAPTKQELAHQYLWRFWQHLPAAGKVTIFDRTWYGRVLVERVEGFAKEHEWERAYEEIVEFENELTAHGIALCKFWVHITKDEQLRRFEDRGNTPHKSWKLTDEDWRNRDKWDDYVAAVNELVDRTSTQQAPWTLVEGNDKNYARVKIIQTVCETLEKAIS